MNEHVVVILLDEPVLLVSEKQQWLSSVMHQCRFAFRTQATRPLPSLSHRRSSLLKHLRVGYQLNTLRIKYLGYRRLEEPRENACIQFLGGCKLFHNTASLRIARNAFTIGGMMCTNSAVILKTSTNAVPINSKLAGLYGWQTH